MVEPAGNVSAHPATGRAAYELPLNERMRTFMRLDFLYQQLLHNGEDTALWGSRATVTTLLDMLAILSRGDIRSEIQKEIDAHITRMRGYASQPGVDTSRLDSVLHNLEDSRAAIAAVGTQFLSELKESDFLNAIKHRSSIPGGTCEFDLPEYSHWLRQPFERRDKDLQRWVGSVRPVCDAVAEVLWLIRESGQPEEKTAINGMFQHSMQRDGQCRLIRVTLPNDSSLFPEISGSQHRFTVRFLEWSTIDKRAVQTGHDISFQLAIC
ncbi:MAG: cell division protein ZapD [Pseudomonadota bacterium]